MLAPPLDNSWWLQPTDDGDRRCSVCAANFETTTAPLRAECYESLESDDPICLTCCALSGVSCAECEIEYQDHLIKRWAS